MNKNDLKEVANQLSCPSGENGVLFGERMNESNAVMISRCISCLSPVNGEAILEIGLGNGALSCPIVEAVGNEGRYIGLEHSETMASEALTILSQINPEIIDIKIGNCLEADIPQRKINGLLAVNVLYFIDDLDLLFQKIANWLVAGGRIVFGLRPQGLLQRMPFSEHGFNIRPLDEIIEKLAARKFANIHAEYISEDIKSPQGDTNQMGFVVLTASIEK
ncbi:class I SAM-dependent methyltransferase [Mangrovimicrobium sediminis]|uniref:Class I SAM-dependent methyltransferase n=1 Tax=Mangrovimicrobium sediminis TaxID=2562682 RepID=A0A4Z0LU57_9GAMM|nr:class I SAM-dependent methyltransferase [Haliea sp. SAOS-164]TGD70615.1 class I SAM-dependent methyltransferase [Haliea sp. SAOS-164]